MRPLGFGGLIWTSFSKVQGTVLTGLGIFATIILSFPKVNSDPYLPWIIGGSLIAAAAILTFAHAAYRALRMSKKILPRVLMAKRVSWKGQGSTILCVLEPSELFSNDTLISFYYKDDVCEGFIGYGTVINIQEDKKIQVTLEQILSEDDEMIQKLANNDSSLLGKIIIKPYISNRFFNKTGGWNESVF